jgi:hypothetical protein
MKPNELDTDLFDRLSERRGKDLISIVIPTHQKGRDVAQDPIRLKNELSNVESQLEDLGWKPRERSDRLVQARALLDDKEFWEHQSAGLAVFVDDESQITPVSIPVNVEPASYLAQVFHLRHLVPGMGLARVPILVLTKNAVRLMYGSKFVIEQVEADLPESFDDVNWFVDREKERQQHPDRVGAARNRHGHEPSSREDEDRNRFLRAVAEALPRDLLSGPLVVLGDDDLVERFGSVIDFETVSPRNSGVSRPEDDSAILELAVPAMERIETARESEALKGAMDRLGVGGASTSIGDALPAAVSGRVGDLVITRGISPVWGRLDATEMTVDVHDEPRPGDVDLLDRLVVESKKTGAKITTVAESIEGDSFIATHRY